MYNRYVPQPDGSYRRNRVEESRARPVRANPEPPKQEICPPPPKQEPPRQSRPMPRQPENGLGFLRQLLPKDFDTGDLMVVLLLLLMAGDCPEDKNNAILTLALYFLM